MERIEIIAVGKELLKGQVLDTNSHWLANQITALGGEIKRMVTVDDNIEEIAVEITAAKAHGSKIIFTVGGLGPTFDDLTLEGVAKAIDKPLVLNLNALEFVKAKYSFFKSQGYVDSEDITPEREKMAKLPQGAIILPNPLGAAPGVWINLDACIIVSLPGVPQELKGIFEQSIAPRLKQTLGPYYHLERIIKTPLKDESRLTKILRQVRTIIPQVYLKSKPTHFGLEVELEVCLTVSGRDKKELEELVAKAIKEIEERISKN
jgi:molybdenum cofactor synthesis domain-containing protein